MLFPGDTVVPICWREDSDSFQDNPNNSFRTIDMQETRNDVNKLLVHGPMRGFYSYMNI